jgi:LuxR family maltose regulon positive regulatory protein
MSKGQTRKRPASQACSGGSQRKEADPLSESDLLVTKITIPPLRSALLHRSHLLEVLEQSRSVPLTLLSAGAGFGKTTLLSALAQQGRQNTGLAAWLSLDEQDNDPMRFWTYVIAALRRSGPSLSTGGEAALAMLHSPQPPLLRSVLISFINELAALSQDIALILDDYHLIGEQVIHASLQFLLDHLPPCLHVLLASRVDPPLALTRLRARGQLVEIRDVDLRLDSREVASFLTEVMKLSLSENDIHLLERRTEGWIVGLQLAVLSMRRRDDVSTFIKTFSGSQRFILDYVQQEILEPLPEALLRSLLYTSVLERMNAELCQALTGVQASQQMLEELERANLFLIPLDEERRWYRWHTLFREVLLARLQATEPEQVAHLHREAARWYHRQGWMHEAISHALATRDFWFAAELLEGCIERLTRQGELQTLLVWIKRLPLEVLRVHPRLATSYLLAFHVLFPFSHQQQQERGYLQQLQEGVERLVQSKDQTSLPQAERDRLHHRLLILMAWNLVVEALSNGNVEQLSSLAEQMQDTPLDDDAIWQQHRLAPFGIAWRMAGNFPPMVAALRESRKSPQVMQNRYLEAQLLWGLIVALIALGQLRQARDLCQELQHLVDGLGGPLPVAAYPNVFRAQLAYAWNQLEEAYSEAQLAIEKTASLQYLDILMMAYEVLTRVCLARRDLAGAEQAVREMERVNDSAGIPLFRPWIEGLWAQFWLARGDLARAAAWAEHAFYRESAIFYSHESASLALVAVSLAQQQYPQALQWLAALRSSAEQRARVGSIIAILALQVAALQASGATHKALHVLDRLLALAEPEGYLRVFLDAGEPMYQALQAWLKASQPRLSPVLTSYTHRLLAAFASEQRQAVQQEGIFPVAKALPPTSSSSSPQTRQPLLEPLTPRELEVLRLLAEGATNQAIADHLVVSLATAKKHVASILRKLGTENRTQAIARARSLSLL